MENVLNGKKNKKKKIEKMNLNGKKVFNPYQQGKVQLTKKKMKKGLDDKVNENLYKKVIIRKIIIPL